MNFLKQLRKQAGLTQLDVEIATGIDTATLSLYENGMRKPTVENAKILGRLYGFSWTKVFEDESEEQ